MKDHFMKEHFLAALQSSYSDNDVLDCFLDIYFVLLTKQQLMIYTRSTQQISLSGGTEGSWCLSVYCLELLCCSTIGCMT